MTGIKIDIRGAVEAIARLNRTTQWRHLRSSIKAAALHIKGVVATYPVHNSRPQPFVSDRQRRGFFARLHSGEIQVPYRRGGRGSQTLGRRWTTTSTDGGMTGIVGNNASYARLVQDRDRQARYHKGTGWVTAQAAVDREQTTVQRAIAEATARDVAEAGGP
jgi:hypothetical protein